MLPVVRRRKWNTPYIIHGVRYCLYETTEHQRAFVWITLRYCHCKTDVEVDMVIQFISKYKVKNNIVFIWKLIKAVDWCSWSQQATIIPPQINLPTSWYTTSMYCEPWSRVWNNIVRTSRRTINSTKLVTPFYHYVGSFRTTTLMSNVSLKRCANLHPPVWDELKKKKKSGSLWSSIQRTWRGHFYCRDSYIKIFFKKSILDSPTYHLCLFI